MFFLSVARVIAQPENANTAENQAVDEPQASRFMWKIDNFTRLNMKKLYSEVFVVGGYKWYVQMSLHQTQLFLFPSLH